MKRNIIDWTCETMADATSAIILTHNIDFLFLQSIVRPRLRKCGHPKLTIFADAGCASGSYQQQRDLLEGLGQQYRVVAVDMGVGRRFHPKAILLTGPTKAALAVGSGNLTHGGWSANHEIWSTYESDDGGLPEIAAFQNYLETVLGLINRTETITDEVSAAFDPATNSWAAELPNPAGLYGIPDGVPLVERIIDLAGQDIQEATLCAPYFDPDGEALGEIARRISAPTRMLLQRNHVGLSASAAASLPENVELNSVDTDPARFIHAKLFAFRRPDTTLLVSGSANISRAALMADDNWGNAELVAIQELSREVADDLIADLDILDGTPILPAISPSDEWEIPTRPIRILAAQFVDGVLEFTFKAGSSLQELLVETHDGSRTPCSDYVEGETTRVHLRKWPRYFYLHCTFENGQKFSSEPAWVDDEASLGVPVPIRRIALKLIEASEEGFLSANGMFEILQLLHQHLQQPTKQAPSSTTGQERSPSSARTYTVDDVFAESFGRPTTDPAIPLPGGFRESDFLKAFADYFALANPEHTTKEDKPPEDSGSTDGADNGPEQEEHGNSITKHEIERQRAREQRLKENVRLRKRLVGALENVIEAMSAIEFVTSRPPERLGADISATALLIRKGLGDQMISDEDFASITDRLWGLLFFGSNGEAGIIPNFVATFTADQGVSFESRIASPQLTAALTLWCFPNWASGSTSAIKFRFAAMLLAAKLPWLVCGGTEDEVASELRRLSRAMPVGIEFDSLLSAWRKWAQAGVAFQEFETAAKSLTPKDLANAIEDDIVKRGDLLWQAGEFYIADADYHRDPNTKALISPLTGAATIKIVGSWLVPVATLLHRPNLLNLHNDARCLLLANLSEVQEH